MELESKYQELVFWYVRLEDDAGNNVYYTMYEKEFKEIYGYWKCTHLEKNLDLIPSNYENDTLPPKLNSFSYSKTSLLTPCTLKINVDYEDSQSGILSGTAYFKNEGGNFNKSISFWHKDPGELSITRYEKPGKIYLYKLELTDVAGNKAIYSVEDGTLEKKEVNIVTDDGEYTLITNNALTNYLDKIKELPDGATVLFNISSNTLVEKEVFDAIKGKDITITFEDIFGEEGDKQGIQWIINGRDIKNITKDINMKVDLSRDLFCPYLISSYKFPEIKIEGNYDGVEEYFKLYNKEQEKQAKDYFNYLKKLGYAGTDKLLKKTIEKIQGADSSIENIIMEATKYIEYLKIEFANNGVLPGEFKVRIKPDYAARNVLGSKNLCLFFVESNKRTEVMSSVKIKNDYYELKISHNSEYWLTNSAIKNLKAEMVSTTNTDKNTNNNSNKTENNSNISNNINTENIENNIYIENMDNNIIVEGITNHENNVGNNSNGLNNVHILYIGIGFVLVLIILLFIAAIIKKNKNKKANIDNKNK